MARCLIDYLTFSSKVFDYRYYVEKFSLSDVQFLEMNGRYGWLNRLYYRGISFLFGGREDICVEISGTGCRTVEEMNPGWDWRSFFLELLVDFENRDAHISRLDVAADDTDSVLQFKRMYGCCQHRRYISRSRWKIWTNGNEQSIYFGSPSSERRLRIYNKALEQEQEGAWIRCELQMRNDAALSFLLNWLGDSCTRMSGSGPQLLEIGNIFAGVLMDFLRFTTSPPENHNHRRCDVCSWWLRFLGSVECCRQIYLPERSYSLPRVQSFLDRQASSSLKLWLQANNGDWEDIKAMVEGASLNKRQVELLRKIEEYGDKMVTL